MSVRRYFCCVIGRIKLENWRLYVEQWTHSVNKPDNRWKVWRRVM